MTEPRMRKLKNVTDEQLHLLANSQWYTPRPCRMAVVPVRITTALLTSVRSRGIPVSKFLREAGEQALETLSTEAQK